MSSKARNRTVVGNKCTHKEKRSGFCSATSTFHSKRPPIPLPTTPHISLTDFISSQPHSGRTAYIDASTGRRLSFTELWSSVSSLSSHLSLRLGLRKGHVVLLLSPNSLSFPIVTLSVLSLGALITTSNPLLTSRELSKQINDSKPTLAFTTSPLLPKLTQSNPNLPIILIDDAQEHNLKPDAYPEGVVCTMSEMIADPPSRVRVTDRVDQDDPASLLYSSGTTGESKGVVSTHRSLIAMVQTIVNRFRSESFGGRDQIYVCTVPMFHIYGLAAFAAGLLASGSTIVVLSRFDLDEMMGAIEKYKATYLPIVPPILISMTDRAEEIRGRYELGTLESVLSGGAPLSREVTEGFLGKYPGVKIYQGYGLTETAGIGASTDSLEESRRYGTAGRLSASMEARVVEVETGRALGVNQTGELWLRGPSVMKGVEMWLDGYEEAAANALQVDVNTCRVAVGGAEAAADVLNDGLTRGVWWTSSAALGEWDIDTWTAAGYFSNPEATASTLTSEGWLKTGDICYIDEDGFIFVVDRLKELIKYKGYQVPPAELEALLLSHPQISDAAVIPFPDKDVGQFPMAYIVRKAGSNLSENAVMDFVAKQVAPFKKIRRVAFISAIPKNPSGKILRKDLIKLVTSKI
ncbi:hypothetical protein Syun_015086 [Stephania yunnanensis]|uniref:4-coumarate--CoA ligase n=1 Tax=Stephania yunnanensis TaxID=152371 RepID=A0AAP0JKH7_9MAGN